MDIERPQPQISDNGIRVILSVKRDPTRKTRITVTSQVIAVENGQLVKRGPLEEELIELGTGTSEEIRSFIQRLIDNGKRISDPLELPTWFKKVEAAIHRFGDYYDLEQFHKLFKNKTPDDRDSCVVWLEAACLSDWNQ